MDNRRGRAILVLALAGALAGCVLRPDHVAEGPEPYRVGYAEGCYSGFYDAGRWGYIHWKDESRAAAEPLYGKGWTEGYERCYAQGLPELIRDEDQNGGGGQN